MMIVGPDAPFGTTGSRTTVIAALLLMVLATTMSPLLGYGGDRRPAATVTGSGDTNYLPRWTGTTTIGNSLLYQISGKIGISTTSPDYKLDVNGTIGGTSITATGAIVGANLDTGQGANELYPMNQAVRTSDNVSFANVTCTGGLSAGTLQSDGSITGYSLNATNVSASTGLFSGLVKGGSGQIASNYATYSLEVGGTIRCGALIQDSDERLKYNIADIDDGLQKVLRLRGVTYDIDIDRVGDRASQIGLIAQEVESVIPEVVYTDDYGMKSLAYDRLVAVLVEAVKQQEARIRELERILPPR